MGKSLNGKELGKGITQRKDGLYQARFINRFGKRQTLYGKTISEITKKLRDEQYDDEKQLNLISTGMTLDNGMSVGLQLASNIVEILRFARTQHNITGFDQIWDGEN